MFLSLVRIINRRDLYPLRNRLCARRVIQPRVSLRPITIWKGPPGYSAIVLPLSPILQFDFDLLCLHWTFGDQCNSPRRSDRSLRPGHECRHG
jgi:hypothetical protein